MSICRVGGGKRAKTHREVIFQGVERLLPAIDNGLPHLTTTRDVIVDEGFPEDHAQLSELGAFNNANGLTTCECEKKETMRRT
jgi:hypothetical protein